jgi:hypothetical protein
MRTLSALAFVSITVACSGTAPASETSPSSLSQNLLDSCEGAVRCLAGSTETWATLHRAADGSGCVVQGATLRDGGTVEGNTGASWTSEAETVRVCQGPSCFTCRRSAEPPPGASSKATPKEKSCKGSVSCPSSPPCSNVRGCSLHTNYHYDGNGNVSYTDYSCTGSAASCSSMFTADSCEGQGCHWE